MRFLVVPILLAATALGQTYQPSEANLKAREWFENARFGMFIHWGVYSVLADGEWVMNNHKMTVAEYEKLPPQFDPTEYNPAEWVALAKAAGMKYITITSKHHDGFGMWGTKQNHWNIVDATPYKKDVLKMLAEECHRQGIKLFFYHSELDWHSPDYFPRGRTGQTAGRPKSGDFNRYLEFMDNQLRELLTGYGDIGGIWFDGWWDKPKANWRLDRTYRLIHSLQPQTLIGNNHHQVPNPGEDIQMFEKDLPGRNTAGFNEGEKVGDLPLETAETINTAWGYNFTDDHFKSTRELVQYLVRAAGANANFLLNIGPRPDGIIQPEFVERLQQMGQWLAQYGDSIYGTRGGPIAPHPWGVTTRKANKVYVHVLEWPDPVLLVPAPSNQVTSAYALKDHVKVEFSKSGDGLLLKLPARASTDFDSVVVLETATR